MSKKTVPQKILWTAAGIGIGAVGSAAVFYFLRSVPVEGWLFGLLLAMALVVSLGYAATLADDKTDLRKAWAARLLAGYLLTLQVALLYLAAAAWLAPERLFGLMGLGALAAEPPSAHEMGVFQNLMLAASAAGLGGGVFMIRSLYLAYCFKRDFEALHTFRYVLLPLAALSLGPVILSLLRAGVLGLTGQQALSAAGIPRFTVVAVSFVLGFAYHDTLDFLRDLSGRILGPK